MKSLAREGAKARLWQLETEKNQLLQAFPDLRDGDPLSDFARRLRPRAETDDRRRTAFGQRQDEAILGGATAEERLTQAWPWPSERHPSSAKASPLRAERRLLPPRRNAGQNCGEKARPRLKAVKTSGMDRRKIGQAQLTRPPQRGGLLLDGLFAPCPVRLSPKHPSCSCQWLQWQRHVFVFLMVGPVKTRDSPHPEEDTPNALRRRGLRTAVLSSQPSANNPWPLRADRQRQPRVVISFSARGSAQLKAVSSGC